MLEFIVSTFDAEIGQQLLDTARTHIRPTNIAKRKFLQNDQDRAFRVIHLPPRMARVNSRSRIDRGAGVEQERRERRKKRERWSDWRVGRTDENKAERRGEKRGSAG